MSYWHKEFKKLKKGMGWSNADVAQITGHTEDSISSMTRPSKDFPRGLRLAIEVYKKTSDGCNWKYDQAAKNLK